MWSSASRAHRWQTQESRGTRGVAMAVGRWVHGSGPAPVVKERWNCVPVSLQFDDRM